MSLTDRTAWSMVEWGQRLARGWCDRGDARYNTPPEGYYDVRLWVTDGENLAHHVVQYIKVTRSGGQVDSGTPADIGAMTLTATDMVVPFTGYTAEVSRSYNSNDIFAPGPLGYGWTLNGISLEIEPYHQGSGEYDEAFIRLPDGRQFFFANNPYDDSSLTALDYNAWAQFGRYTTRPYGMQLYRPGGSRQYHAPWAVNTELATTTSPTS